MVRGAPMAAPARKDEDESLVLFGELYRHGQDKEVNLLDPMYSVEFEAIQGQVLSLLISTSLHVHFVTKMHFFPLLSPSRAKMRFRVTGFSKLLERSREVHTHLCIHIFAWKMDNLTRALWLSEYR